MDVAVDPLEGTNIVASGGWNALAVLAIADRWQSSSCTGYVYG